MQELAVGNIFEGKVTGITKFGAFVELPDGKTGMVHISEVTSQYVKEISDHLTQNQIVKVKVLAINPEGKISLSIKRAVAPAAEEKSSDREQIKKNISQRRQKPNVWSPKPVIASSEMTFEDMLAKFKQTSEDKISDLKKIMNAKRNSSGRKGQK